MVRHMCASVGLCVCTRSVCVCVCVCVYVYKQECFSGHGGIPWG